MNDEPRRPGRPRKTPETTPEMSDAAEAPSTPAPPPPGPIQLEIRINGKIACLQRVHTYKINQTDDTLTVTGELHLS